jgi:dipeptidyl aminopeptidase/acylaminoacyl peptidase
MMRQKAFILIAFILGVGLIAFVIGVGIGFLLGQIAPIATQQPKSMTSQVPDRSLDKYTIPNLGNAKTPNVQIQVEKLVRDYPSFTSNLFAYSFDPTLQNGPTKKVSGLLNLPKGNGTYPIIVMIRGYVDPNGYFPGNGTINASLFFAGNGFITVAPDFLGYGESDKEASDIFEARFQTYTTVMVLLKSLGSIPQWDHKNVFIWAHSNGGQIALTTLEVTGVPYPTTLWAPVSSSFPFSILYYSDETADKGKWLRKTLSQFEDIYDTDLYSTPNYLTRIKASINLDQGTADTAVPVSWSDDLAKALKAQGTEIDYNVYPGADHVMTPLWNSVIQKDLQFFLGKRQ